MTFVDIFKRARPTLAALVTLTITSACQHPTTASSAGRSTERTPTIAPDTRAATLTRELRAPITAALQPLGVKLLGVRIEGNKFIIDLSREFLALGEGRQREDATRSIHNAAARAAEVITNIEYVILVDGKPIPQ